MSDATENKLRILVADDSRVMLKAFSKILGADYEIVEARDGEEAWARLQEDETICSVFTDMNMPNVNGLELLTRIRSAEDSIIKSLPVILVTSFDDDDKTVQEAFALGITVLIRKPFDTLMLKSCAKAHIKPRHLSTNENEQQASLDPVTKLANKAYFIDRGEKDRAFSIRQGIPMAVAILGIKDYSSLAEQYPEIIKSILIKVSSYTRSMMRQEDTLAHLGSGQFGILTVSINPKNAVELFGRIQAKISSRVFSYQNSQINLKTSIGLASADAEQDQSFNELMNEANINFAEAKKHDNNKLVISQHNTISSKNIGKQFTMLSAMLDRAQILFQQNVGDASAQQVESIFKKLIPIMQTCNKQLKLNPENIAEQLQEHSKE